MPEKIFPTLLAEFLALLQKRNIKAPLSIELVNKEEALKIVQEVCSAGFFLVAPDYDSVTQDIQSGALNKFLLLGIEFYWSAETLPPWVPSRLKLVS